MDFGLRVRFSGPPDRLRAMTDSINGPRRTIRNARLELVCAVSIAIAILAGGCALFEGSDETHAKSAIFSVEPPVFLNGPMGVLLVNPGGFHAHVALETQRSEGPVETESGEIFGKESLLVFAPGADGSKGKYTRAGGLTFLWDVAAHRGFAVSEALQGYAPMSSPIGFTNLAVQPSGSPPEKINGHRCESENAKITSSDGVTTEFEVKRATDLQDCPLLITASTKFTRVTLRCSKVQLGPQPAELFQAPEGFTAYESIEGMMGELAMRTANLKRKEPALYNDETTMKGVPGQGGGPGIH